MYKLRQKERNGQNTPMEVQISSISSLGFFITFWLFILGFRKHISSISL